MDDSYPRANSFFQQNITFGLESGKITGTKGDRDESTRRGAGRKIGRKGLELWASAKTMDIFK